MSKEFFASERRYWFDKLPAPKFEHLERIVVCGEGPSSQSCHGERGAIVWLDSSAIRKKPEQPDRWLYLVHLPACSAWKTFFQSDLDSLGEFDPESEHLGTRAEISFDLVLKDDNDWMEGSYRLPGEFWKVVIFQKDDVPEMQFKPNLWQRPAKWEREMTGIVIRFPRSAKIGREEFFQAMSQAFGRSDWVQVKGPDSMILR